MLIKNHVGDVIIQINADLIIEKWIGIIQLNSWITVVAANK